MAFRKMVLLLFLWRDPSTAGAKTQTSRDALLPSRDMDVYSRGGDVIFGAVSILTVEGFAPTSSIGFREPPVPRYCQKISTDSYQAMLAMVFATEEINQNDKILPRITLGFQMLDSCSSEAGALKGTLWLLSGQNKIVPNYNCRPRPKMAAFIGEIKSSTSMAIARVLGLNKIPQISYASVLHTLSDKTQFPSFFRTVSSDAEQPRAILQLLMVFKWTWIGVLISNNDICIHGSKLLKQEAIKRGICIEFFETLPNNVDRASLNQVMPILMRSTATVIVFFAYEMQITPVLKEISAKGITGKIWIATTDLMPSPLFTNRELWEVLNGTLGMALYNKEIPGFKEFFFKIHPSKKNGDVFMTRYWEQIFRCTWKGVQNATSSMKPVDDKGLCTGRENLQNIDASVYNTRFSYSAYNAIYALAQALDDMISCKPQEGPFANQSCADLVNFQPWQLFHYVKNVRMMNSEAKEKLFDSNGDTTPYFDVLYWHMTSNNTSSYERVGTYNTNAAPGHQLTINKSAIHWGGKFTQIPRSVCSESCPPGNRISTSPERASCCFHCVPCPDGSISQHTDSTYCVKCLTIQWSNSKRDLCIPKDIEFLSFEEPLGFILVLISIFFFLSSSWTLWIFIKYRHTPVVRANNLQLSYLLLVSLMLCFLCSLIFIGQPTRLTCMLRQVIFGISFSLCVSCVLAKTTTVVIAFRATKPNSNLRRWVGSRTYYSIVLGASLVQSIIGGIWLWTSPSFPELNTSAPNRVMIGECNEGSILMFYCMLAFMGLLACVSFVIAFLSRNLPDSFNEAKFITFSMLVFVTVWLSFIPAYLSTKGKYLVAVEIFAIMSSGAGLLYCIFAPKVYIIFFRPDMNTRKYLASKPSSTIKM